MDGLLGLIIVMVADIYVMILLLHLFLDARQFYMHPFLMRLHDATEPLLRPLRNALGNQLRAVLAGIVLVLIAQGLLLWVVGALGYLVSSPATDRMSRFIYSVPGLTPIFMSLGHFVDWMMSAAVIGVAITALIEPYTHNPLSRIALRFFETGESALGPLASPLAPAWQKRLMVGIAFLLANTLIQMVMLAVLGLLSGQMPSLALPFLCLGSALTVAIAWGFQFFILLLFVAVLMSWFDPNPRNPLVQFIGSVSYPLFQPFRRWIPPIAGIDVSPAFAIILLVVARDLALRLMGEVFGRWVV